MTPLDHRLKNDGAQTAGAALDAGRNNSANGQ
jgi:hypothetical protein